jgi:hypothetical protein
MTAVGLLPAQDSTTLVIFSVEEIASMLILIDSSAGNFLPSFL